VPLQDAISGYSPDLWSLGLATSDCHRHDAGRHGVAVLGVDTSPRVLGTLERGDIHIHELGPAGRRISQPATLVISRSPRYLHRPTPFLIAVSQPSTRTRLVSIKAAATSGADMRAVISGRRSIVPFLRKGNLVLLESTSLRERRLMSWRRFSPAPAWSRAGISTWPIRRKGVLPGQILRE